MTQVASPISDLEEGDWTSTPLYEKLNEAAPNDASYVSTIDPCPDDLFIVKLSPIAWPRDGTQALYVRLRGTDTTGQLAVVFALLQGSEVIAERLLEPPAISFTTYSIVLSSDEIRLITDYENLNVEVTAACCTGGHCATYCPDGVPGTLIILPLSIEPFLCPSEEHCTQFDREFTLYAQLGTDCSYASPEFLGVDCEGGAQVYEWLLRVIEPSPGIFVWELDLYEGPIADGNIMGVWNAPFTCSFPFIMDNDRLDDCIAGGQLGVRAG
jgi:hypothetical protein